jgi:diadenylate cyclase
MELFKIGFFVFNLIDMLDIMFVSFLFYWIYKSLRNTIAIQILLGMVIILGLQFITEASNLRALNWILRTISDVWLLAFIILFQPELRKMLMIITRNPIFKLFVKSKISETLDETIEATIELAEKHIGALIVFSRTQNVQMTVDTGIPLQAVISKELLMSIFSTKSPLHDGAVIMDNNMVVAARCVLPLSSITKFGVKNLGTRHRAALGLSEQVDSIVLIVSEETGGISIAQGGELTLNIPEKEIYRVLKARFAED